MTESNQTNLAGVNRPIQIIPSVLPADWANMGACVKELEEAGVDRIQFDVMDGNFVPNLTFGPEMIAACRKYCSVPFETQLMVSQYNCETMLESYVNATKGPNGEPGVVIAHAEANIPLPAIKQLAPASAHCEIVQFAFIPPSTSMSTFKFFSITKFLISLILLSIVGI